MNLRTKDSSISKDLNKGYHLFRKKNLSAYHLLLNFMQQDKKRNKILLYSVNYLFIAWPSRVANKFSQDLNDFSSSIQNAKTKAICVDKKIKREFKRTLFAIENIP